MPQARLVDYRPEYLPAYVALNREWIERYFRLEPMDLAQLENPGETILRSGGAIFFVLEDGLPVGTCAMVKHGDAFELAKMAVAPAARGRGYGGLLLEHACAWAKEQGAARVTLLSNTVLEPAIQLYRKHGFRTVREGPHPDYERCNIEMEKSLRSD
jgi:GNAT superfamily N-acetyltransferase